MKVNLLLAPLLALYVTVIVVGSSNSFAGDEGRYVWFANNLSQGYYTPTDDVNLWNGPGYPVLLLPFLLSNLPWIAAKLLNALLLFGAVLFFFHTLRLYMADRTAFVFSYLLGIYPPLMREAHMLLSESLAIFLLSGFAFCYCRLHKARRKSAGLLVIASFFLAYLALTKILFGYVILVGLLVFLVLYMWKRQPAPAKSLQVYSLALVLCLPYLFYTYSLTGKIFYWGNSGGMSLYWMSSPFRGEMGDWFWERTLDENEQLAANHQSFFDSISGRSGIEKDDAFRQEAIKNIIHHPTKFVSNWLANVGRLLFSYPFSYTPQKLSTYFYLLPNMFIVVGTVLSLYPGYRGRRVIPHEVFALVFFALVAFVGSSLLSAYERQFRVLVPIFCLWILFILTRLVKIEIRSA